MVVETVVLTLRFPECYKLNSEVHFMRGAELWIGDGLLVKCMEADERLDISTRLNKRVFRVADTPLTYRQINVLDGDGLIDDRRPKSRGWRKFNFREMVYLHVVSEVKKYGMKHDSLDVLREGFLGSPAEKGSSQSGISRAVGDIAIMCVFLGVEIFVTVDAEGRVIFWDPVNYAGYGAQSPSHIRVVMNPFVNRVVEAMHKAPLSAKSSLRGLLSEIGAHSATQKEERLLTIIRDRQYESIRVKKKDGELSTVYAETVNRDSGLTEEALVRLVRDREFRDIKIVKRDGKIVSHKVEDTYKL
jgi:hypothetical protein